MLAPGSIADLRQCCVRGVVCVAGVARKKRVDADPRRPRKRHRPLDAVAQLPHIAGPGVVEQSLLGFGVKPRTAVAMLTYLVPVRE